MPVEGQGGSPELVIFRTDDGLIGLACSRCDYVDHLGGNEEGKAWRTAAAHLYREHGLRRVWIDDLDQSTQWAVQLAIPLLLDGQARATERATLGPRP